MFRKKTERLPGFSSVPGYYIKKKGIEQHGETWTVSQGRREQLSDKKDNLVSTETNDSSGHETHRSNMPPRMTRSEICIDNVTHEPALHSRPPPSIPSSPVHCHSTTSDRVYNRRMGDGFPRGISTAGGGSRQFLVADSFSSKASFMDEFAREEMNYSSSSSHHLSRESVIRNQCGGGNIVFSRYPQPPPDVVPQHELHRHTSAVLTGDNYGPSVRFHRASTTPGTLCDVSHSLGKSESPSTSAILSMEHDMLPQSCQLITYHHHHHHHPPCPHHHQHPHSHQNYATSASLDRRTTSGPVGRKKVAIEVPSDALSKSSASSRCCTSQPAAADTMEDMSLPKHSVSARGDQLSTEELDRILDNLQSGQPLSIKKRTQSLDLLNMQNRLPSSFVEFERYLDAKFQDEPGLDPSAPVISVSGGNSVPRAKVPLCKAETKGRFFPLSQYNKKRTSPDILPSNSSSSSASIPHGIKVSPINKSTPSTGMDIREECVSRNVAVQHPTLTQPIKAHDGRPNRLEVPLTTRSALKSTTGKAGFERIATSSPNSEMRFRDRGNARVGSPVGKNEGKSISFGAVESIGQSSTSLMSVPPGNSNVPMFPEHFVPSYCVPGRFTSRQVGGKNEVATLSGQGRTSPFESSNSAGFSTEWLLSPISNIVPFPDQSEGEHQQLSASLELMRSPSSGHADAAARMNMKPNEAFLLSVDGMVEAMGTNLKFIQLPELLWPDEDALYEQIRPLLQKDLDLYLSSSKSELSHQQQRPKHQRNHSYVNECCGMLSLTTGIAMDPINNKESKLLFAWLRCASPSTGVIYYHSLLGHCQRHHPNLWMGPSLLTTSSSNVDDSREAELMETLLQLKNQAGPIEIAEPVKRFFNAAPNNESPLFHIHLKCKSLKDLNVILSQVNLLAYESMQSILIAYETYRAALVRLMYIKKHSKS